MGQFRDFDVEVSDDRESTPEHHNGIVTTAGTPVVIAATNSIIQLAFINVPSVRDPSSPNALTDAIKVSTDGGTTYTTLMSGESLFLPGVFTSLKLDTNANGTTYQVILWS